jgi:hypothetical protein
MSNFLLCYGAWVGLGMLFSTQNKLVFWDGSIKRVYVVVGLLLIFCLVLGPFASLTISFLNWLITKIQKLD